MNTTQTTAQTGHTLDEIRRCAARSYNDAERTDSMLREAICNACDEGARLERENAAFKDALKALVWLLDWHEANKSFHPVAMDNKHRDDARALLSSSLGGNK